MDTNKDLNGGKFKPGMSASGLPGAAKAKDPKIHENSVESELVMEGFIGLPKNVDKSEGLQQKEEMEFEHCGEWGQSSDMSSNGKDNEY